MIAYHPDDDHGGELRDRLQHQPGQLWTGLWHQHIPGTGFAGHLHTLTFLSFESLYKVLFHRSSSSSCDVSFQTILTTVVVDKVGFHLEPRDQVFCFFFSQIICNYHCLGFFLVIEHLNHPSLLSSLCTLVSSWPLAFPSSSHRWSPFSMEGWQK